MASLKDEIFGHGPVAKAKIIFLNASGKEKETKDVQFNPTEYSIARSLDYQKLNGIGQEIHPLNTSPSKGALATLTVSLVADVTVKLGDTNKEEEYDGFESGAQLAKFCERLAKLSKYNHDDHLPEGVEFCWGTLQFMGHVTSATTAFSMFDTNGNPVKAKIDLTIEGEERKILSDIKANPNESPDRTKYRNLGQVDQLWMLAYDEYGDTSSWKIIAKENGILNPRKRNNTTMLKVPSI
jgi:hypothetical protein